MEEEEPIFYSAVCGPTLLAAATFIQSPNYPESYTARGYAYMCQWIVPTNANGTTVVEIKDLNLAPKDSEGICSEDALLLSNSIGEQQTLCGSVRNDSFFTVRSIAGDFFYVTLMVRTSSNASAFVLRSGFHLHVYSFAGEVQGNGQISSPGFPESFPHRTVCRWTLTSNTSTLAVFTFLHINITKRDCRQGGVIILWTTDDGSRERKFCDRDDALDPFTVLIQESHAVKILFQISGSYYGLGRRRFKIRYFGFSSVSGKCYTGREILKNQLNYTSPNYPEFYNSSMNVSSVLKYYPPIGKSGIFTVTWFDFSAGTPAVIEVISQRSTSSETTAVMSVDGVKSNYSQRVPLKAFSEVRMMWNFTLHPQKFLYGIRFTRSRQNRKCQGAKRLRVDSSNQQTEFVLGAPRFRSWTNTSKYSPSTTCKWIIDFANKTQRVPAWVQFYWMKMDFENGQFACRNDYVQIERERYSERVCKKPKQRISFARQKEWPLKLMFKSDILWEGKGFKLKVTVDKRDCVEGDRGYCGWQSGSNVRPCCNRNETCCLGGPSAQGPYPMRSCNLPEDCPEFMG
ncbi:hypothetical protein V1264_016742 [Littorina saxatilis]|uniref:CUB domain-containing protein n=1 Tax=Littorina saxatilis TaxID=31220 RepID=A0AAN9GF08_9CAEN